MACESWPFSLNTSDWWLAILPILKWQTHWRMQIDKHIANRQNKRHGENRTDGIDWGTLWKHKTKIIDRTIKQTEQEPNHDHKSLVVSLFFGNLCYFVYIQAKKEVIQPKMFSEMIRQNWSITSRQRNFTGTIFYLNWVMSTFGGPCFCLPSSRVLGQVQVRQVACRKTHDVN